MVLHTFVVYGASYPYITGNTLSKQTTIKKLLKNIYNSTSKLYHSIRNIHIKCSKYCIDNRVVYIHLLVLHGITQKLG